MSKSKFIRTEKCVNCEDGVVSFYEFVIDEKPIILGNCNKCDTCCENEQNIITVNITCEPLSSVNTEK